MGQAMIEFDDAQTTGETSAEEFLANIIHGSLLTQLVCVAARLGVADHLNDGPKSSTDLATLVNAQPQLLYRVLRTLASHGVFVELEDRCFELNATAELLRSDTPDSMRHLAIVKGVNWQWQPQGALYHQVTTGEIAFDHVHGKSYFDYLDSDADAAEVFNKALLGFTKTDVEALVAAYDFSDHETVIDIGGGEGSLLAGILKANPGVRGIVADRPAVLEGAKRRLAAAGVADRCKTEDIDFFQSVPGGGDAYIMRKVIHDWNEADASTILKNCHAQMTNDARLLLIEAVVPPPNDPRLGKLFDIEMMVYLGGAERTEAEFRSLFQNSGLELVEIIPTRTLSSVIVGKLL